MYIFFEDTVKRKCEIKVDIAELLEYESLEEYVKAKRRDIRNYEVFNEEVSDPMEIEMSNLNTFDESILNELLEDNDMSKEEYEEFVNATI